MTILQESILNKAKNFVINNKGKLAAAAALAGGAYAASHYDVGGINEKISGLFKHDDNQTPGTPKPEPKPTTSTTQTNGTPTTDHTSTTQTNGTQKPTNGTSQTNSTQKPTTNVKNITNKVLSTKKAATDGSKVVTGDDFNKAADSMTPEQIIKQNGGDINTAKAHLQKILTDPFAAPTDKLAARAEYRKLADYAKTHNTASSNKGGGLFGWF